MLWYPDTNRYHGSTPSRPDHVQVWFELDPDTGDYATRLFAWRGVSGLFGTPTLTGTLPRHEPIDVTFDPWPGLPSEHTLKARFTA